MNVIPQGGSSVSVAAKAAVSEGFKKPLRPDIQGLRAIAVLSVVATHAFPSVVTGGYVGVDIFFVISGYLITGIVLRGVMGNRFSIREFYVRRVRRIVPALIVMVLWTALASYFVLSPRSYSDLGRNIITTMTFVSNFDFRMSTNYFGTSAELQPLLHMWSLSVEEQYYIFFPLFVSFTFRGFGEKGVFWASVLIFCLSLARSEMLVRISPSASYYLLPSRAFELMIGSILSLNVIPPPGQKRYRAAISFAGLLMIALAIFGFTSRTPFPGFAALLPCIGTALLILAGDGDGYSPGGKLISGRSMVFIGNISYSWYLWHWPVLSVTRNYFLDGLTHLHIAAAVAISFALACLSYRIVERPFLSSNGPNFPHLRIGAAALTSVALLGAGLMLGHGVPGRFSPAANAYFSAASDFNAMRTRCHDDGGSIIMPYAKNCTYGAASSSPDVAVWGDSHGAELAEVLGRHAAKSGRSVMEITTSACPPALNYSPTDRPHCAKRNSQSLAGLVRDDRITTVILVANSERYRDDSEKVIAGMGKSIDALLRAGKRVVVAKQIPIMEADPPTELGFAAERGQAIDRIGIKESDYRARDVRWNAFVDRLANKHYSDLSTVDPAEKLCLYGICRAYDYRAGALYFNAEHLSNAGADFAFQALTSKLYN